MVYFFKCIYMIIYRGVRNVNKKNPENPIAITSYDGVGGNNGGRDKT